MTDDDSTYATSEVVDAISKLLNHSRKRIVQVITKRFYWFEHHVSAPTIEQLVDEAENRIKDGRRHFNKQIVRLDDPTSVMSAFVGVVLSVANDHVKRMRSEAERFEEFGDDGSQVPNYHTETSDTEFTLPPDEILQRRQERARLERIRPRSEANVEDFMQYLADKDPALYRVCAMRREHKENKEIALVLNIGNKQVGNLVGELKRQAARFFSMPKDEVRRQTRPYRSK